jgi:hypothetical protein
MPRLPSWLWLCLALWIANAAACGACGRDEPAQAPPARPPSDAGSSSEGGASPDASLPASPVTTLYIVEPGRSRATLRSAPDLVETPSSLGKVTGQASFEGARPGSAVFTFDLSAPLDDDRFLELAREGFGLGEPSPPPLRYHALRFGPTTSPSAPWQIQGELEVRGARYALPMGMSLRPQDGGWWLEGQTSFNLKGIGVDGEGLDARLMEVGVTLQLSVFLARAPQ